MANWNQLLQQKADAMNKGQTLAPGQTAGGWTAESVGKEMASQGFTPESWYKAHGKNEGFDLPLENVPNAGIDMGNAPKWNTSLDMSNAPKWNTSLDMSGAPAWATGPRTDWEAMRKEAADSARKYLTSGYDERFQRGQSDLESQLTNQGLRRGTEAWDRAMTEFTTNRDRAYEQANTAAYNQGLQEMAQLFGMDLSANQFQNQTRGQYLNEMLQQGQFGNQARQQYFNEALQSGQFQNQTRGQYFNEMLQSGQFGNQAALSDLQAELQKQGFKDQMSTSDLNRAITLANYQNQLRQQQIQEAAYQRNLPLNELISLISGTQLNMPQFSNVQTAQSPYMPYYQPSGGSNFLSSLVDTGGSLGSAAILGSFLKK